MSVGISPGRSWKKRRIVDDLSRRCPGYHSTRWFRTPSGEVKTEKVVPTPFPVRVPIDLRCPSKSNYLTGSDRTPDRTEGATDTDKYTENQNTKNRTLNTKALLPSVRLGVGPWFVTPQDSRGGPRVSKETPTRGETPRSNPLNPVLENGRGRDKHNPRPTRTTLCQRHTDCVHT